MAKKSKGFRELLSQESPASIERQSFSALEKKLARDGISPKFVPSPKGGSISDALRELVKPYLNVAEDRKSLETLFAMGIFAWNVSVAAKEDRQDLFDKFQISMQNQDADMVEEGKALIQTLIERKEQLFPDNHRTIMNFELKYTGRGNYHISVASTIG
jgi:hypothetical protein